MISVKCGVQGRFCVIWVFHPPISVVGCSGVRFRCCSVGVRFSLEWCFAMIDWGGWVLEVRCGLGWHFTVIH